MNQEQAKQKAIELVDRFMDYADPNYHECSEQWELNASMKENSKQCALISLLNEYNARMQVYQLLDCYAPSLPFLKQTKEDYELIKTEIEKL